MATINAIGSNIPIEIAKGGTNASSMSTTDGVIYYDGTKLVTTSAGSAGQILTSNGAGVAPTFQAVGSFPLTLLNTQTASSSASLTFTSTYITSTYSSYFIKFTLLTSSGSAQLQMTFSTDNGSSYLNSNYLAGATANTYNATSWTANSSTTLCPLSSTSTWLGYCGYILIDIPTSAAVIYSGKAMGWVSGSGSNFALTGTNTGTTTVNNIKFAYSSGNITSGSISLYGVSQ